MIRVWGYSSESVDAIASAQVGLKTYESSRRLARELLELAREQSSALGKGESYPGSSEVIESIISKSKSAQGQHNRGGFTKMLLAMGAGLAELSASVVAKSLACVRESDVRQWSEDALGTTLTSLRRSALPGIKGA